MKTTDFRILEKLKGSFKKYPSNNAFIIDGVSYTYFQFQQRITAIQKFLLAEIPDKEEYIGVVSHDHIDTYASVFALWFTGKAFVPINPLNPSKRNQEVIRQMRLNYILNSDDLKCIATESEGKIIKTENFSDNSESIVSKSVPSETDAYVLFTSGSAGKPLGIKISRQNLDTFYDSYIAFGPEFTKNDRFLQANDISFNSSMSIYLAALCTGASVYTVPQDDIKFLYSIKLIKEHDLTIIKMTPSTLFNIRRYFEHISLPSVRCCIFAGDALPLVLIEKWMRCIPNALIQNAYGPTEVTINALMYNFNEGDFQGKSKDGIISLGKSFGDFEYAIVNKAGSLAKENDMGELCLHSKQITIGYWDDVKKTESAFLNLEISGGIRKYYKTGDIVSKDKDGYFFFHNRTDNQVQIQGFRVELEEIEKCTREFVKSKSIAAIVVHSENENSKIILFVGGVKMDPEPIMSLLSNRLPAYMMPSKIIFLKELPMSSNGKPDREKLSEIVVRHESN